MEDLRRAQQRLGRDAAPIEADAPQIFALDDRSLEAKLRRTNRGNVAARTGADDYDVEARLSHLSSPVCAACYKSRLLSSAAGPITREPTVEMSNRHHHRVLDQRLEIG